MIIYSDNSQKFRHENYPKTEIPSNLKGITMALKESLEALVPTIEALTKDGITIFECFAVVKAIEPVFVEFASDKDEAGVLEDVKVAWQWADEKWKLVDKADEAIKLPFYIEPLDGWAIRKAIEVVALPQLAHGIWALHGKQN